MAEQSAVKSFNYSGNIVFEYTEFYAVEKCIGEKVFILS